MHLTDMQELLNKREQLIDELVPYQYAGPFGLGVHHPLVIEIFFDPERAGLLNARYRHKVTQRDEALEKKNWETYIFLHERPYRVRALSRAMRMGAVVSPKLVRSSWTDSENIWQNKAQWQNIWRSMGDPRSVMDDNEQTVFKWMPEEVTVHRGIRHRTHWPRGMSWTRDKERAVWFAHRLASGRNVPTVLTAKVLKKHVLAYVNARGEEEVVVMPRSLREVTADERRKT
jgi:hypothetical protein